MATFVQHSDFQEILLNTGDYHLLENATWIHIGALVKIEMEKIC